MHARSKISAAVLITLSGMALLCAQPAFAQQAPTPAPAPDQELQRVVVTGSSIKRVDAETPSPVQVLTAEDLKRSGFTSVADVLSSITANGAGTLSANNSEAFAGGATGIALRGLDVGYTLTLIDGHRMAPYPLSDDGERQFVDVTNIPFDTIERIEVLKDGASALYGSDAIAGVVNIILKKEFRGTTVNAEIGTAQHGGDTTKHASITSGFGDLDADGFNSYISLEVRSQSAINADQRSGNWLQTDWTAYGGNNLTPGMPNVFNNNTPQTQTPYLVNSTTGTTQLLGVSPCGAATTTTGCAYANPMVLQPQTQNINLLASFTKKLPDDWELNVKGSIFNAQEAQHNGSALGYAQGYPLTSNAGGTAFGPGQPPVANSGFQGAILVPAGYAGNTNGASYLAGLIPGIGQPTLNFNNFTYRLVADLDGTIGAWDIAASAGFTRTQVNTRYSNFVNNGYLQQAVNAGTWALTGVNSAAELATVAPDFYNKATDDLTFVELHASRELMTLPGGPLSLATGLNFVHKSLNNPIPEALSSASVGGTFEAYAMGREDDSSAFAEIDAPVLKSLELDAAARYDHYSTFGNSFKPKFGFKFKPMDELALRGTLSQGFRAPSPAENGTAGLTFGLGNPIQPDTRAGACPGGGSSPTDISSLCQPFVGYLQSTNPHLKPETSTSGTLGLIFEPIKGWSSTLDYYNIQIKNQITSAAELSTYANNPYPYINPQTGKSYCVFGPGESLTTVGGGTAMSSETISYCNSPYINANSTKTSGLDFESHYKFKLPDASTLFVRAEWTHVLKYTLDVAGQSYELAGTHGPSGVSGDTGNPRDRQTLTFTYDKGPADISLVFNRVGSYTATDPSAGIPTCTSAVDGTYEIFGGTAPASFCKVAAFLDTDLTVHYQWNKSLSLHGSVMNLFDKAPPLDIQTYAGSFLPYNPSQHMAGVIGRFFNVGATYTF